MKNYFKPEFSQEKINQMPILALAHIGDSVFEMLARCSILEGAANPVKVIHKMTVKIVCAEAQCKAIKGLLPSLTQEETDIFMRGRNAKPKTIPKNASHMEYAFATGLEVLFGWLYLNCKMERINELFSQILSMSQCQPEETNA